MKYLIHFLTRVFLLVGIVFIISCNSSQKKKNPEKLGSFEKGSYGYDLALLKKYTNPVELESGNSRILVSPEYQGRVMTSSSEGRLGKSYGWINHDLIASGEILKQINPVGGEERFWLGPEGGQFSVFFKPGDTFDFDNWKTPASIDTEPFNLVKSNETEAVFTKNLELMNYNHFVFQIEVKRKVEILAFNEIKNELGIVFLKNVKNVGYQTINQLKNTGNKEWIKETGLLSIWLLGMFNPSPSVTIIIPYRTGVDSDYIVKDDYFGKISGDRLVVEDGIIFFKGDGKERGKLGLPPERALPLIGSYDGENRILTVVKCDIPEGITDYVNSSWEFQEFPYRGDAINSYNDGPVADGTQLGPFYELETSSPALALKPTESAVYKQSTFHFEGTREELNALCQQIFDTSIDEVEDAFP